MRAHFGLPSVKSGIYSSGETQQSHNPDPCQCSEQDVEKRAPITVKFEIPYFTVSGIQVRYLKVVEKSGYQALPWVRYITQNGDDYRCVCKTYIHLTTNMPPSLRTALDKGSAPIVPM
jgi:AP-1 complex subunit mu